MSRKPARVFSVMAALLICSAGLTANDAQQLDRPLDPIFAPGPASASDKTWEALQQPVEIDVESTPLKEVVEQIAQQIDVPISIDERGLQLEGMKPDHPVRLSVSGVKAKSALLLILKPWYLELSVKPDGRIVIDSTCRLHQMTVRIYEISELLDWPNAEVKRDPAAKVRDLHRLRDLIVTVIQPGSWSQHGGSGSNTVNEEYFLLTVRQTDEVHAQMAELLEALRGFRERSAVDHDAATDNEQILTAIGFKLAATRMSLSVADTPLDELVQKIAFTTSLNFMLDLNGLNEEGLASTSHVTVDAKDQPVDKLLAELLKPLNLDYVVEDEVVKITSRLRAMGPATVIVYPVGKLLSPTHKENESVSIDKLSKLADEIQKQVAPEFWDRIGGVGTVTVHESTGSLVIRQVMPVHEDIQAFLETKRSAKSQN